MTETTDRQPDPAEQRRRAVSLAMAGIDWAIIAEQCQYASREDAIAAVSDALDTDPVDALSPEITKQLQIARMSRMLAGVWGKATKGDARSIEVSTRLIKEMCALQGVKDLKPVELPDEPVMSAYDELAARRPGTQSGPRRQRGRRRQAGPTA